MAPLDKLIKILEAHSSPKLAHYISTQLEGTAEYKIKEDHIPHILLCLLSVASTTSLKTKPHIWEQILLGDHPNQEHPFTGRLDKYTPYNYTALSILNILLGKEGYMAAPRNILVLCKLKDAVEKEYPLPPPLPKLTAEQAVALVKEAVSINGVVWTRELEDKLHEIATLENKTIAKSYYPDGTLSKYVSPLPPTWNVFNTSTPDQFITYTLDCMVSASALTSICFKTNESFRCIRRIYPSFKVTPSGQVTVGWLTTTFRPDADVLTTQPSNMSFEVDDNLIYQFIECKYRGLASAEFV